MTKILYSDKYVDNKIEEIKKKIQNLKVVPKIALIRTTDDAGTIAYEKGINSTAKKLGVEVDKHLLENVSEEDLISEIKKLNDDKSVGGILIFKPLPENINEDNIAREISPEKDIDCLNPLNMAKVYAGDVSGFIPLAPKASIELLKFYDYKLKGKETLVINHSNVVGKPLTMILLNELATVTIAHIGTQDLKKHTKNADIIFTAVGKPEFLDKSYFNENATVIDIGTSKNKDGKFVGDLNEESVDGHIKAFSPVPKGVGSITNILLIENVVNYYINYENKPFVNI